MSTVATDGLSMSADGQVTSHRDYVVSLSETKIKRVGDKIVGCCGGSGSDEPFIQWLRDGGEKPELDENFCALVIGPEPPRVYWHDYTSNEVVVPYSIGSGAPFALAAMDLGKSPADAVTYATTRDVFSGGVITTLFLETELKAVA
jgi:ATP-dependent protease HslVU (ClpYQ) peptidase subunit